MFAIEFAVGQAEVEVDAFGLAHHIRVVDVDEQILVEGVVAVACGEYLVVFAEQGWVGTFLGDQYQYGGFALVESVFEQGPLLACACPNTVFAIPVTLVRCFLPGPDVVYDVIKQGVGLGEFGQDAAYSLQVFDRYGVECCNLAAKQLCVVTGALFWGGQLGGDCSLVVVAVQRICTHSAAETEPIVSPAHFEGKVVSVGQTMSFSFE